MANPKVIIADTDINYIAPLQYKFINDYFNNIDLEIITDRQYFTEYFSRPQNAEILIVSEDLYDLSIKRHDIKNIFVMSEEADDGSTGDLSINKLYKYTSIMEIFSEIVAKSAKELAAGAVEKKETQVILVTSACGGVGKTTVAMGLAGSLAEGYQRVLYINASQLQNFQYLMEEKEPITASEIYAKAINADENFYFDVKQELRTEGFTYLPAFKAALLSMGISFEIYRKLITSAKKSDEYDYIVVDTDVAFDEEKLKLIDLADKVFVVTEQSLNSVQATNNFVANVNGINADKYVFLCNKFRTDVSNELSSPVSAVRFNINDYIGFVDNPAELSVAELGKNQDIKKISFLVM